VCNGKGKYYWSETENKFKGTFVNNKRTGFGVMKFTKTGSRFEGQWLNDQKHGKGIEHYGKLGSRFEGYWLNDKKHGYGYYYKALPVQKRTNNENTQRRKSLIQQIFQGKDQPKQFGVEDSGFDISQKLYDHGMLVG